MKGISGLNETNKGLQAISLLYAGRFAFSQTYFANYLLSSAWALLMVEINRTKPGEREIKRVEPGERKFKTHVRRWKGRRHFSLSLRPPRALDILMSPFSLFPPRFLAGRFSTELPEEASAEERDMIRSRDSAMVTLLTYA